MAWPWYDRGFSRKFIWKVLMFHVQQEEDFPTNMYISENEGKFWDLCDIFQDQGKGTVIHLYTHASVTKHFLNFNRENCGKSWEKLRISTKLYVISADYVSNNWLDQSSCILDYLYTNTYPHYYAPKKHEFSGKFKYFPQTSLSISLLGLIPVV